MRAIVYLRCSTAGQATEGVSIEVQRGRAEAWAQANGYTLAGVFSDEGISGKRASNRPGLHAALQAVCEMRGALVVYSLSRLARSTKDALAISDRLSRAGADLVSLSERIDTTSAAGKMVFRMLAVLAEFERDLVSERTKAAMSVKRSRGERVGEVPYGYEMAADRTTLIANPEELAVLSEIRRLREGGMTWREIADELNARGVHTKKGLQWNVANIWAVAAQRIGAPAA